MKAYLLYIVSAFLLLLFNYGDELHAQDNYYLTPEFFNTQQGLSSSKITCITKDDKGFIWIGTDDGLNKYDGNSFTVYKMRYDDSTSLFSNHILSIHSDSRQHLWVGTSRGLQYYDPSTNVFVSTDLNQPSGITQNHCNYIFEDSRKNMWFAISGIGVLMYSPHTNESYTLRPSDTDSGNHLCSYQIKCVTEDKTGNIWFGSQDLGISVYNPDTRTFSNYNTHNSDLPVNAVFHIVSLENGDMLIGTVGAGAGFFKSKESKFVFTTEGNSNRESSINKLSTFCVFQTSNGTLLAGTEGMGIKEIDPLSGVLRNFPIFHEQKYKLGDSKIHFIFEDKYNNLWVGFHNNGICVFRRNTTGLRTFRQIREEPNSLSFNHVSGITSDAVGNIWFATDGGGLNRYHRPTGRYHHYRYDPGNPDSLTDDAIVSVFCDSKGRIWAGTYTGGLCRYVPSTDKFIAYRHDPANDKSISSDFVKCITEDSRGQLWIGTNGGGICRLNPDNGHFRNYSYNKYNDILNDYIISVFVDKNERLWIGTYFGLTSLDLHTGKFHNYSNDTSINNSAIYAINEDNKGQLWIGTSYGLMLYDSREDAFIRRFPTDDIFNSVINGIIPSGEQLWLSTNKEIVCYVPADGKVHWFSQNSEFLHEFLPASYYKSPEGEIFFGANEGCYSFFPWYIQMKTYTPKVYLSNLKIFDKNILPNKPHEGRIILTKDISYTDKIVLQHLQKSFTLEFTAPDTQRPSSTIFACRMDGFDNDWVVYNNGQRSVTYTNFEPGTYTFHVKATNTPGIWNNSDTKLTIEILTPVWATWWAKLGYLITVLVILFLISRLAYTRIRDKNELGIERLKVKQQEELSQSKMQFFTNISHEFRTPLTLIIGPLEQIQTVEKDPERSRLYQIMLRNANRLLLLINQILDLRKAEKGKMKIAVQQINLISFAKDRLGLFTDLAKRKKISLSYQYNPNDIIIWYDPDMLEKCIYNLLSNAFKFTPEGGKIQVTIKQEENEQISLSVSDNGCGMSAEEQSHLFEYFFQGQQGENLTGSGIGLYLTKSIIEQHSGSLHVESSPGKGSCFTIFILPGKKHFNAEDISEITLVHIEKKELKENSSNMLSSEEKAGDTKPYILLVEDEEDMRHFIRQELETDYFVTEATNGREALESLINEIPDLIITDVMMPDMNGIELCRIIKEKIDTCHIPVIILTALGEMENRIEGLETGADSYISKPFQSRHLRIRIEKLLESRRKMKERFSRILNIEAQEIDINDTDELLMQNAVKYIRSNMENPDLSVDELSKVLNMSRTNLHRRIKTTTGLSPIDLIKTIRMKQAAYLLSTGNMNVSEVAYKVGYSTPSYFSSSFSAYYNVSPITYLKSHSQSN